MFSSVGLGGCIGANDGPPPVAPMLEYDVPGLTSILENGRIEVYESLRVCCEGAVSVLAALCLEPSPDFVCASDS
jgi:hypothetical protein